MKMAKPTVFVSIFNMKYFLKIDRYAAWLLFTCLLFYFLTGFGMTKGIISADFATKLHLDWLNYFILVAFVVHTGFAIHLAFKRWRFWNPAGKTVLVLFYLIFIGFFIWVDNFYEKNTGGIVNQNINTDRNIVVKTNNNQNLNQNTNTGNQVIVNNNINSQTVNANQTTLKTFTLEELAQYNGQNNRPAYAAVDGIVYDMTSVFVSGTHYSHFAGQELTSAFYQRHFKGEITKYPVVGKLQ